MKSLTLAAGAASMFVSCAAMAGGFTLFNDRTNFESQLGSMIVDGFDDPGYDLNGPGNLDIHSNAVMSAVLGETDYETTGFSDWNLIINQANDAQYCAGCNGSFLLSFTTTSVGTSDGVFGVGLDIRSNSSGLPYHAFVTFGDGTTTDVALPAGSSFFGISSNAAIQSIHFGLENGGSTTSGSFVMDNLTIGNAVPAPGALALLGLAGFAARRRRRA